MMGVCGICMAPHSSRTAAFVVHGPQHGFRELLLPRRDQTMSKGHRAFVPGILHTLMCSADTSADAFTPDYWNPNRKQLSPGYRLLGSRRLGDLRESPQLCTVWNIFLSPLCKLRCCSHVRSCCRPEAQKVQVSSARQAPWRVEKGDFLD